MFADVRFHVARFVATGYLINTIFLGGTFI